MTEQEVEPGPVLRVLAESVPDKELQDVVSQLPGEIAALLTEELSQYETARKACYTKIGLDYYQYSQDDGGPPSHQWWRGGETASLGL